jgi:hypothetical protein
MQAGYSKRQTTSKPFLQSFLQNYPRQTSAASSTNLPLRRLFQWAD